MLLLHFLHGLFRELLSGHALDDVLLSSLAVSDPDEQAGGGVHSDGAAENYSRQCLGSDVVVDAPCASAQGDLQTTVQIEKQSDGN